LEQFVQHLPKHWKQGDQIGRIFASWLNVNFENYIPNFWANFFPMKKVMCSFWPKMGWATIWVIFPLTHLVTLTGSKDWVDKK
jgi:hypothetical protein